MSYRPHPTKGPGWWYILKEAKVPKNGKLIRKQTYLPFQGSESEVIAADAEINGKEITSPYPTITSLIPRFLAAYQNNNRENSYAAMEAALKYLLPYYGDKLVPLISDHHHEEYKALRLTHTYLPGRHGQPPEQDTPEQAKRRKPISKNSINRELNCLKSLLAYAESQKIEVGSRPKLFPSRQIQKAPIVPLPPSQLDALTAVLNGPQKTPIMLMIYAGLRLREATELRCEDIHLANKTLYVVGKGGSIQPVQIDGPLLKHLEEVKGDREEGWLVVNPKTKQPFGDIMKTLNTFARKAGITKKIGHHTLRHSCATGLILAGEPLPVVQGVLRHSSIETTMLYVHISSRFRNPVEETIARRIFGVGQPDEKAPKGVRTTRTGRVIGVISKRHKAA